MEWRTSQEAQLLANGSKLKKVKKMKKTLLLAATALMAWSCATDALESGANIEAQSGEQVSITVSASEQGADSRVGFEYDAESGDITTKWISTDQLSGWDTATNTFTQFAMIEGSLSADGNEASFLGAITSGSYRLIHPYEASAATGTTYSIDLSAQTTDIDGDLSAMSSSTYMISPEIEVGSTSTVSMNHIGSAIKVAMRFDELSGFDGLTISQVELSGLPTTATIDLTKEVDADGFLTAGAEGTITATVSSSTEIEVYDEEASEDTTYDLMLNAIPFTLAADATLTLKVTFTTTDGATFSKMLEVTNSSDDVEFARSTYTTINMKSSGENTMTLNWSDSYETDTDVYVKFTSPAVSPDGESIYVTSSAYNLVSYNTSGEKNWSQAIGTNPSALNSSGNKLTTTPTPSVDTDGIIYAAAGFNEPQTEAYLSALTAFKADGSVKWSTDLATKVSLRSFAPTITDSYIYTANHSGSDGKHFRAFNKTTGELKSSIACNSGCYGGLIALRNGVGAVGTGDRWGCRVIIDPTSIDCSNLYSASSSQGSSATLYFNELSGSNNLGNYGRFTGQSNGEIPYGSSMAADKDQKMYILFDNNSTYYGGTKNASSVIYCYDTNKTTPGSESTPEWGCVINGYSNAQNGQGLVLGADGTVYAATFSSGSVSSYITAVSSTGSILWEYAVEGVVKSSPAVDSEGCVYYNDQSKGKLVKLSPDGEWLAEILIADDIFSSPTIADDGTIYVNGMKNSLPTLFSITNASTEGYADSWSQLGGSPQKTFCKY